ncbi:hypothetical protein E4U54_004284 [Claviceps lovelessii]|nr:hypothetical protein E4U54_004284 [Claviceps lovelessii]
MSCRIFELLTILATLAGLAFGQELTLTGPSSSLATDVTTTRNGTTGVPTMSRHTITTTLSVMVQTGSVMTHCHHNNSSDSSDSSSTTSTTAPTTTTFAPSRPTPIPLPNAGRRPTQPGLRKLTIVVGLATYGLILL